MTESETVKRKGLTYVCEARRPVVKLEVKHGRVVATLDDGTKMIVPTFLSGEASKIPLGGKGEV